MRRRELGLTTVEFAIVATVLFTTVFAVIEFGRLLYTYVALAEGTRRAARLGVVCPLNAPGITSTANFAILPNFTSTNVQVQYLDGNGNPTGVYGQIAYVRVQIVGYAIPLSIPLINPTIIAPAFPVTLPRESLGVTPLTTYTCS
jgi:TadE-like protein